MIIYLTEPGFRLGVKEGHFYIQDDMQKMIKEIPIRLVSNVVIYASCIITGAASMICLKNKIPVFFLSAQGRTFGKLITVDDVDVDLVRKQVVLTSDEEFCLKQTKNVIDGKIRNQLVFVRRLYRGDHIATVESNIEQIDRMLSKVEKATSIPEVMGIEGTVSRVYFQIISEYLPQQFKITKRTKHPPEDPINSILSFAYALLHAEVFTALELAGLNPYFSFMHKVKQGHAALASDMLEEFRAVIADPLVIHFANYGDLTNEDFDRDSAPPAVYLKKEAGKKFLTQYEKKMQQKNQYLGKPLSFRESVYEQAKTLANCVRSGSLDDYQVFRMR